MPFLFLNEELIMIEGIIKKEVATCGGSSLDGELASNIINALRERGLYLIKRRTLRDAERYLYIRQGEDVLGVEDEDTYNAMWREIQKKGNDRQRMDAIVDAAIVQALEFDSGLSP